MHCTGDKDRCKLIDVQNVLSVMSIEERHKTPELLEMEEDWQEIEMEAIPAQVGNEEEKKEEEKMINNEEIIKESEEITKEVSSLKEIYNLN